MAKQIKVRFGKGDVVLAKSTKYVGIKRSPSVGERSLTASLMPPEMKDEIHPSLGGFQVVKVKKTKERGIDEQMTFTRGLDEVETATHVYHLTGSDTPLVPTGRLYIQFQKNVTEEQQKGVLAALNLDVLEHRDDNKVVVKVSATSPNPIKCAMELGESKYVKWAEPDIDAPVIPYAYGAPTARLMGQMWHLQNNGRIPDNPNIRMKVGADAKVVEAWKLLDGFGNPNIVVAVIDNGFDTEHPDLASKVFKPWDLWNQSPQLITGDTNYTHGTPCAGVAIATQNRGMCGAAPVARFMPISGTGFSIESTENMFNYVIQNGADVVSCSWGTVENGFQLSPNKVAAISRAARDGRGGRGAVICYAAGNEGVDYVNFYGTVPDVICVAACTSDDDHADYSNTGPEVTIAAPSNGAFPILSARASWDPTTDPYYGDEVDRGPQYQHFGGTSSATPLVAGICALILSANSALTAKEVKQIICQTADKIGNPNEYVNGKSLKYGYGRINALKAVQEALRRAGKTLPPSTPTNPQPTGSVTTPNSPQGNGLFRFTTSTKVANKGFTVQVGSFNQFINVKNIAPTLESKFKQPAFVHIMGTTPATMMYRLLLGQFNTLADANKFLSVLKANSIAGFVKDFGTLG